MLSFFTFNLIFVISRYEYTIHSRNDHLPRVSMTLNSPRSLANEGECPCLLLGLQMCMFRDKKLRHIYFLRLQVDSFFLSFHNLIPA